MDTWATLEIVAREPQFVIEYSQVYDKIGQAAFQVKYRGSFLIGLGMVAKVSDRPLTWRRRTLATVELGRVEQIKSIVNRVWRICKDPGAQRGPHITLGQSADNDIVLPEYTVSTQHCAFVFDAAGMSIHDIGSLNGVKVNDALIEPQVNRRLKNGMNITLGRVKFKFVTAPAFVDMVADASRGA